MHFPRLAHMETILSLQGWGHSCRHHYVWTLRFPDCSWDSQDGQVNLALWARACVLSLETSRLRHACSVVSLHVTYKMSREKKNVEMMGTECDTKHHHPLLCPGPCVTPHNIQALNSTPPPTLPRSKREMKSYVLKETLKPSCPEVIFCRNHTHESLCLCLGNWAPPYGDRL